MADKPTTPEAAEGAPQAAPERSRRRKRAAPTIDLTATEVPPPQDAAPRSDPPPAADDAAPETTAPPATPPARTGAAFGAAALAGGAAGVVAALVVLLGLYFTDLFPLHRATTTQASADTKSLEALTRRVGAIEAEIKKLPAGGANLADRLAAAEAATKSLGVALATLTHRSDDIAANAGQAHERADAAVKAIADLKEAMASNTAVGVPRADFDALGKRVAALESAAQSAQSDIGKIAAKSSGDDRAARLALSAAALRDAVASGAPFTGELAAVKSLGGDDRALAPLIPFAAAGVPAASALARELTALLPAMIKIANASAPQGGFLERLEANAGKLVRVRPVAAPPGDEPSAVLARLETDTAKADVAAALDDLGKLDGATRGPAQGWMQKAQARQAALAAARQLAADSARALVPPAAVQ